MKKAAAILTLIAAAAASSFAADAKAGQAIFEQKCKACHGADGTPNAGMAKMFPTMRPLGSADVQSEDIKAIITTGKGKMKPIAGLSADQVDNVVAYVHSLKK